MYKSFVTCNDPKGVVECCSNRKSKVASMKMDEKPRNRTDKSLKTEQIPQSSFIQNHGLCHEASLSQSKSFAKELLKGALDLQDSLAMLGNLRKPSHYVSKSKNRKEKLESGIFNEVWCERTNSYRFGFHNHRVSADEYDIEELRNAIRDKFAKQKLLKSPNLIAKLMGLEEIPQKSQPLPKMVDSQRKTTLEEILKTPQCQGLTRKTSAKEHNFSVDDVHPIIEPTRMKVDWIPEEREARKTSQGLEKAEKTQIRRQIHKERDSSPSKRSKEEIIDKKVDKIPKVVTSSSRKPVERTKNVKIYSSKNQKLKEKPARDNTAAIPVPEIVKCKEEEKKIFKRSHLAEELFHLNLSYLKISPLIEFFDDERVIDTKIFLDYAVEFMERRSISVSRTRHPLLLCKGCLRIPPSIDQLVEEIRGGIQTLESYHKGDFDGFRGDSIYGILERDMLCGGFGSGVWDLGWRDGFEVNVIEEVVKDLEVLVVSELMEEVIF